MSISIKQVPPIVVEELRRTVYKEESIVDFLGRNMDVLKDVVLFGGAIRDIFLFGELKNTSDLDFVVRCNRKSLAQILSSFNPRVNKFGGFRFYYGNRRIDIWALEDTWAIKSGYVSRKHSAVMLDLLETTFFNIDSVYFRLQTKNIVCSKEFLKGIESRKLKINLLENPSPCSVVKRIRKMRDEKGLEIDGYLESYIAEERISDKKN